MKHPHLPNAPITEALIDLRADLPDTVTIDKLAEFQALLGDEFPRKQELLKFQVQVNPGASSVATRGTETTGLLFFSEDSRRAVHARRDGFAFSWLRPYATWEELRDDGRRLWRQFVRLVEPERITRAALRYINRMELPQPVVFQDYLNTFPNTGEGVAPQLSGLYMRLVAPDDAGMVVVTEAIDEKGVTDAVVPVILDIDVFKAHDFGLDDDAVWKTLEALRDVKNRVFFGSVTQKALELFR